MKEGKDYNSPSVTPKQPKGSALILTADKTEDLELFYPYYRMVEAGYRVDVATTGGGKLKAKHGEELHYTQKLESLRIEDYDLLYIPGGAAPDTLRGDDDVVEAVKRFAATGKPIAAICHGPQLLIEAELVSGKRIAAWPEVAEEIREAGAIYADEACTVDGQFITGRWPGDLPTFMPKVLKALESSVADNYLRTASGF